ncbi:MAG TPA: thioredoxin-dependent thiol peroxidase [Tepidisphaeraceae bacterium]|nr:thioredoxin-dependent thiol peroxidase [Tepidisphaeraceae bacterium]
MSESHPMPKAGDSAPTFILPASTGETIDLASVVKKGRVVLYFYPKADTPGCTTQACGFRDSIADYRKAKVTVLGLSPDPIAKVKKFVDKFQLNFPLLADADHAVCDRYGVWVEKSMYGKKYWGAARVTFILAKGGKIEHVFEKVKPAGHEAEVLAWINANP